MDAQDAEGLARRAGLSGKKAAQVAKFAKLVPLLSGLADLGFETSGSRKSGSTGSGLEILESIGLDLETGLAFLKENNLDISDGLRLLGGLSPDDDGASLKSLTSLSQLLGMFFPHNFVIVVSKMMIWLHPLVFLQFSAGGGLACSGKC